MKIETTTTKWRDYTVTSVKIGDKIQKSFEPEMPYDLWQEYLAEQKLLTRE